MPHWRIALSTLAMLILILFSYALTKYTFTQQLFILFMLKNYVDSVDLVITSISYIHYSNFPDMDHLYMTFLPKSIVVVITFPLMLLFMKKLLRPILNETEHLEFWKLIWLIPFFFHIIFHLGIVNLELIASPAMQIYFLPYAWAFCTFLTYYLVLYMVAATSKTLQLEEKLHISELQISMQGKEFDSLQETIASTRKSQHDMRHLLLAIQGMAQKKDYNGIEEYIESYLPEIDSSPLELVCGNPAIDAVLQHYASIASKKNIQLSLSVDIPPVIPQNESDVCVVLGNLLENAVEACSKDLICQPYINLRIKLVNASILAIVISNSYSGQIRQENNAFLSSKREDRIGIGIVSVKNITEKYHGLSKFTYDGSQFTASLILHGQV